MLNRLREVFRLRAVDVLLLLLTAVLPAAALDERRVHDAEHAVRLAVGGLDLQRLLARGDRFVQTALPHVQPRQLGHDVRCARIELCRSFERRDRAVDVVRRLEVAADQELGIRFAAPIGLRALSLSRSRKERNHRREYGELHDQIVPQKREGVIYSAAWPSNRISSKFWRVPTVKRRSSS